MTRKSVTSAKFDICVIGAGAAGLSAASGAAQLGLKVALIEEGKMGGDCLNTGCVPSKSLLAAAKACHNIKQAAAFGIYTDTPQIDFDRVRQHISDVIGQIAPHDSEERFAALGVTVIKEKAAFISPHKVRAGTHTITAKKFVIATGSRPIIPDINGLDSRQVLTNETIFALEKRPDHLVIIGGGPIGTEMAQAFARLGSKVTLLDKAALLPKDDPEAVVYVRQALIDDHVNIKEHVEIETVRHHENHVTIHIRGHDNVPQTISGSHLLVAAGRYPQIYGLGLEKAGVNYNKKGIITDHRLRSSQKHIYAVGDVVGGPQFTHVAGYQAGIIIRNALFKIPARTDYSALPWVTYTDPELAQAGLTEKMARGKYGDKIKTISKSFAENDRARTEKQPQGMIKIITTHNDRIIGVTIASPHAGELIGLWGLAIARKMKARSIANMIAPYPTYGEISKHAAGAFYTNRLFSTGTKRLVRFLWKLPF